MESLERIIANEVVEILNEAFDANVVKETIEYKVREKTVDIINIAYEQLEESIDVDAEIDRAIEEFVNSWLDKPW